MKKIEKIYISKILEDNMEIINKVLVQYIDGSAFYFCLPNSYNELNNRRKLKERKKIEDYLEEYMEELRSQNNSNPNYLENNKVIIITEEDLELKEYVDLKIEKISQAQLKHIENINISTGILWGLIANLISYIEPTTYLITSTGIVNLGSLLNTILSSTNFLKAIITNHKRDLTAKELKTIKSLKLYFSYLMLTLNIGFGINNLKVNYKDITRDITYLQVSRTVTQSASVLSNPFSEENSAFLVTTEDAKVNLLMEAFDKNSLINEEDLEIAISLKEYLEKNPYLNYEELYETFATIGIIHSKNYDYGSISGVYYQNSNIIEIFKNSYEDQEKYEDVLQHEIIHSTGSLENKLLNEGMTSLLQAEFSNDYSINDSYYDHVIITKIFCELITPEKMLAAYTKKDMSIIKQEMLKLNSNETDYNNLMNKMNKYSDEYQDRYQKLLLTDIYNMKQEELPSYEFYQLFNPYLTSDKLSETAKEIIPYYIQHIGYWVDVDSQFYFNKEENILTESNQKKINDYILIKREIYQ